MSFESWRLVGVKMAKNDIFFNRGILPSVRGLAGTMLRRHRRKLPVTSGTYSSSICHSLPSSVWELEWCSGYDRCRVVASEIGRRGESNQHHSSLLAFRLASRLDDVSYV